jgi:hypothetical protein
MNRTSRTQTSNDFGHNLSEIVDHLMRTSGFHWPISLAVIDPQGQMMLQTIKPDWAAITVHYPPGEGGLHMSLYPPIHRMLVDGNGRAVKATLMDTGGWLLG